MFLWRIQRRCNRPKCSLGPNPILPFFNFVLMINTVFFGLQWEAYFSEFGLYFHGEYFRLNRALIKHWSQIQKLQKIMVQKSESTFTFESNLSKSFCSSLPCFLCSSAALESLHTEAKASSLVVCQSKGTSSLGWDEKTAMMSDHPSPRCCCLDWWPPGMRRMHRWHKTTF